MARRGSNAGAITIDLQGQFKDLEKALRQVETRMDRLVLKFGKAGDQIQNKLSNAFLKGGNDAVKHMRRIGTELERNLVQQTQRSTASVAGAHRQLVGSLAQVEKATQKVNNKFKETGNTAKRAAKEGADATGKWADDMDRLGNRMRGIGTDLSMAISVPVALIGGASIKAAMDFETAMAGVAKTVDAPQERIDRLAASFIDMSETIPVSANELAGLGQAAGQLGIKTKNIEGFTRVMADLGVATNLTSDQAATQLARLANITQMSQTDFDRLGSSLVHLGNNLATTEAEIVEMAMRIAGTGRQIGLTEAEVLGFAGALSSLGIESEMGGTAISRVFAEIGMAVGLGGEKLDEFARIAGMSTDQFVQTFETDATTAIIAFIEGIKRLEDEGENVFAVLQDVEFQNVRVRDALLRAAGAGDLLRKAVGLGTDAWEENNALTKEAERFYATTANQLKMLWNQVKNIAAEFGAALLPAFRDAIALMRPLMSLLRDIIEIFSAMPGPIRAVVLAVGALLVAIPPLIVVAGQLVIALGALSLAGVTLSGVLAVGAPVLIGLAALAAAFGLVTLGAQDSAKAAEDAARKFEASLGTMSGEQLAEDITSLRAHKAKLEADVSRFTRSARQAAKGRQRDALLELRDDAMRELSKTNRLLTAAEEQASKRNTLAPIVADASSPKQRPLSAEDQAKAREAAINREIALLELRDRAEESMLTKRIAILDKYIKAEEDAGRKNGEMWIELSTERVRSEEQLVAIQEARIEKAKRLEQQWLEFRIRSGEISLETRKEQLDAEIEALKQAGKQGTEEHLKAEMERLAISERIAEEAAKKRRERDQAEKEAMRDQQRTWDAILNDLGDTIADVFMKGKLDVRSFVQAALAELARLAAKMLVLRAMQVGLGSTLGGIGGGILQGLAKLTGFAANGANVGPGEAWVVGEKGPELFMPGQSGQVRPVQMQPHAQTLRLDFGNMPKPRNIFESARDAQWQQLLRESLTVAKSQGF